MTDRKKALELLHRVQHDTGMAKFIFNKYCETIREALTEPEIGEDSRVRYEGEPAIDAPKVGSRDYCSCYACVSDRTGMPNLRGSVCPRIKGDAVTREDAVAVAQLASSPTSFELDDGLREAVEKAAACAEGLRVENRRLYKQMTDLSAELGKWQMCTTTPAAFLDKLDGWRTALKGGMSRDLVIKDMDIILSNPAKRETIITHAIKGQSK